MPDASLPVPAARVRRVRWRARLLDVALYATLIALAIPFVFPFLWMVSGAFKSATEIFAFPPRLVPETWRWGNFVEAFAWQPFARHYLNSVYIAVTVTIATIGVASLSGYAFARIRFPGRSVLFILLLSALMMPSEVTIVPNFFLMNWLGLIDTHVPLIVLPVLGGHGIIATFLMRQAFLAIPREIEEAAMIDGLGRFGIFRRIAFPLARPAVGAVAIVTFLYSWNLFLEPLVFVSDLALFTLPLSLRNFADVSGLPVWHLQLAATTMSVVPVLVVYLFAQRQIIASFASTGVKG